MDARFQQVLQLRVRHALPLWVVSAAALASGAAPAGGDPGPDQAACVFETSDISSLRELEPLPGARPARLLALDGAWIPRQQPLLPQLLAVPLVRQAQRPRDRQPQRARLPRLAASRDDGADVERAQGVRRRERLLDVGHERSEEHTSELQSLAYLVCRLLLEK